MAGPETALALGQPDLSTDNLGGQPAMAPMTTQAAPAADQLVQGQQQASRPSTRMNVGLQAPQLNPNQVQKQKAEFSNEKPWESRASGGDFIAAPRAGQIPWGIIADRAAQVQKQKAELAEGMKKMFGGDDFKGKAAPPYEVAYQQYVRQEQDRYVQDWANAKFGGDTKAAIKDLYTNPDSNRQWMAHNRSIAAVGETNKYKWDKYEELQQEVNDNKAWVSRDTQAALDEFLNVNPYSSGKTAAQLADGYKQLEHKVGRDKLWNDTYLPRIKEEFDTLQQQGKVITSGGRKFLSETETRSLDRLKEQTIRDMVKKYGVGEEADIRQYVDANMPRYEVTKMDELSLGSSGGSSQAPADKVWTSPVQVNMANTDTGGGLVETVSGNGVKRRTPAVQSISVGHIVDGRQEQFSKATQFRDGNTPVKMIWTGIDRGADGSVMLVGYDPASIDTDTNVDDLNMEIGDLSAKIRKDEKYGTPAKGETEDEFKARLADQKKRRSDLLAKVRSTEKAVQKRMVPLKGNEGVADGLLGGRLQQELAKFGGAPASSTKPAGGKTIAGF